MMYRTVYARTGFRGGRTAFGGSFGHGERYKKQLTKKS
jgi:hypothetical protein